MTTIEKLHRLIDDLPAGEWHAAECYLTYLRDQGDPFLQRLEAAPCDDEPETEEERQAVEEGRMDLRAGRTHSMEEVKRELKL